MTGMSPDRIIDDEQLAHVRGEVRALVRAGFSTEQDIARAAVEILEPGTDELVRAAAEIAAAEWADRLDEQETWTGHDDHAALAAAFAELEALGIVARMNVACCSSCGHAEMGTERDLLPGARGYVFFHAQESARLAGSPTTLHLFYSAYPTPDGVDRPGGEDTCEDSSPIPGSDAEVGQLVTDALAAHGLSASWDGRPNSTVQVTIADWRKRLPGTTSPRVLNALLDRRTAPTDPTPAQIETMFRHIELGHSNFLILTRADDPNRYFQAIRTDALRGRAEDCYGTRATGSVTVEYRDGGPDSHFQAECPTFDLASKIAAGWSAEDGTWHAKATWHHLAL